MLLQASTSWLNSLIALAGGASGNLRLVVATPRDDRPFDQSYIGSVNSTPPTDATIAGFINSTTKAITVPGAAALGPLWLEIPNSWVKTIAGAQGNNMPTERLQLSTDCGADFQGAWGAVFQALGFTSYSPSAAGPWPVPAG